MNKLSNSSLTHLRPGSFYNNLYSFADIIKFTGILGLNYDGEDTIVMASPVDIAVEESTKTSGEKVRHVSSDDVTMNETADILGVAIGKQDLKWV